MRNRKTVAGRTLTDEPKSFLWWVPILFVVLFLFVAPFSRGLFNGGSWEFDGPIYKALICSAVGLIVLSIYFLKNWKLNDHRDLLSLMIWLIPVSFLVSTANAASLYSALKSINIHVMYAMFFVIGLYFTRNKWGLNAILYAIMGSGYAIVIFGLLNWLRNAHYKDAVLDNRLSSVFQYPNAYAAYLIGLFLSSLILLELSKKWYVSMLHSFMLVPLLLSFLLTLSRGAIPVFIIVMVVYLLFLPFVRQILHLFYILLTGLATILILGNITSYRYQLNVEFNLSLSLKGWFTIIAISLILSAILYLIRKYMTVWVEKREVQQKSRQFIQFIIPAVIIVVSIASVYVLLGDSTITNILPGIFQDRLQSINISDNSVLSRNAFFSDAFDVIRNNPLIGVGGGGWSSIYSTYQSYVYTSNQAHSFYLQYMVETGWIGFLLLFTLLIYVIYKFVRHYASNANFSYERLVFALIAFAFLIHSIIDFNMSFLYVGALVFLCLGGMVSFESSQLQAPSSKWLKRLKIAFPILVAGISVCTLIYSVQMMNATEAYAKTTQLARQTNDYNEITRQLNKALDEKPTNPDFVVAKLDLVYQAYNQTKDNKYYDEALIWLNKMATNEPYNRQLLEREYLLYMSKGDLESSSNNISRQLMIAPWEISYYERKASLEFDLGYQLKQKKDEQWINHWDRALSVYKEWLVKREQIKGMPEYQKSESMEFYQSSLVALPIGKIHFLKGEYQQAGTILKEFMIIDSEEPLNKEVARWYLAALEVQGLSDEQIKDALLKEDPAESDKIKEIVTLVQP